jgi:hypothetical protein
MRHHIREGTRIFTGARIFAELIYKHNLNLTGDCAFVCSSEWAECGREIVVYQCESPRHSMSLHHSIIALLGKHEAGNQSHSTTKTTFFVWGRWHVASWTYFQVIMHLWLKACYVNPEDNTFFFRGFHPARKYISFTKVDHPNTKHVMNEMRIPNVWTIPKK